MKRRVLALLMSALLCLSLLPAIAFAAAGDSVLAFTSDTHNTSDNAAANVLDGWIDDVQLDKGVIDYMGFCGDLGDSSASEANYWAYTQAVMNVVAGESIEDAYVPGNHEHINGNFPTTTNTVKNNFTVNAEAKNGDNYRVYCLGSNSSSQDITAAQVTALTNYLNGLDNSEPIFILNHYPLHYYSSRTTTNAASAIDALNAAVAGGKKIVFLWGHNHTLDDPSYDQIFVPGSSINPSSGTSKTIQFYYAAAGCMYGYGGNGIDGRGLVVTVSSSDALSFAYYKADGTTIGVYNETGDPGDPGDPGEVTNAAVSITSSNTAGAATASATISVGGTLTITLKNGSSQNSKTYATTINDGTVAQITSGASLSLAASATGTVTALGLKAGTAVITSTGTGSGSTYTATINLTVTDSGDPGDPGGGTTYTRVTTPAAGKQYVIVAQDGSYYGLTNVAHAGYTNNSNYSYSGFNGTPVTVAGDKITSAVSDDMIWKLEDGGGGRFVIKNVQNSKYLNAFYNSSAPLGGGLTLETVAGSNSWGYSSSMLDYSPISGTTTKYLTYDSPSDANGGISSGAANLFTLRSQANSDNVYFYEVEIHESSSHTVTFNSNGGTGSMSPQTASVATALSANSFTRTGYTFTGWNTVATGGGTAYTNGQTYSFAADAALYAQWIVDGGGGGTTYTRVTTPEAGKQYVIVAQDGSSNYGLTNVANSGYENNSSYSYSGFNGTPVTVAGDKVTSAVSDDMIWKLEAGSGGRFLIKNVQNSNYLDAFYNSSDPNMGGGLTLAASSQTWGYSSSMLNYSQIGTISTKYLTYDTEADVNGGINNATGNANLFTLRSQANSDNVYFYEVEILDPESHIVTFNSNGGAGTMSPQMAGVTTALTANAFTRTGYAFNGWNTAANGSGTAYTDGQTYSFAADVTLYAQWIAYGDVNADGTVSDVDRTILARYLAGWPGNEISASAADVNADGSVSDVDRTILARHLAGWSGYETLPH